ncbi:MAG: hypothetical protein KME57_15560 [Scytonema hyalinum WJT4-NPBG1]|jgi:hypothetical protein|nr:hypothetical protein [Scytonema hyalinum WJT4-NPBG1]
MIRNPTPYPSPSGFASRLRRETRLQRWTHRKRGGKEMLLNCRKQAREEILLTCRNQAREEMSPSPPAERGVGG